MAVGIAGAGSSSRLPRSLAPPLAGLVILLGLKLGVLVLFGPTMVPDSAGYIAYADAILTGSFLHVDLAANAIPITLARPIGYPAIIAAGKIIAGANWAWAVVFLQFGVSVWATCMVYRLARMFRLGIWVSLGVAAAQATSMQFVVDQSIASDSLCASTMTIAACILSGIILTREHPHLLRLLGVGGLIVVAFLLRDVIEFLAVGFAPLAAAAAMSEQSRLRRLAAFALVFIPLIVAQRAYVEWNRVRVGAPVVTTVSQWTLLDALGNASQFDPAIFSGSAPIDLTGRRVFKSFEIGKQLAEAFEANTILHRDYGWSAVRIAHEVTVTYLRAWIRHPWAMIRHALTFLSETQVHQAVRVTETVRDVLLWNTGSDHEFARDREVRNGNLWMIPAVIAHRLIETLSVTIFAAFILITPFRLIREGLTAETSVSAGLLCVYLVVGGLYAAVHLEPRYLTPVVAGSIVIGVVNIAWLISRYRRRPAAKPAEELPNGEPPWTIP